MIKSGKALEKFREAVVYQGGDPSFIDDYETLLNQNMFTMSFHLSRLHQINGQ